MTISIKEYAAKLTQLAEKYPNAVLVCAADDEGNGYRTQHYLPEEGHFDPENQEWVSLSNFVKLQKEYGEEDYPNEKGIVNAVIL